jgi:hypothetical protein
MIPKFSGCFVKEIRPAQRKIGTCRIRSETNSDYAGSSCRIIVRAQRTDNRRQMSENREQQNIEGKENFIIRNSLFDIRYSK